MKHAPDLHALVGAYALDALDDAERARFERHLGSCAACGFELAGFRETAARLAAAAAEAAPPALKSRTLSAAQDTRQLPPIVRSAGSAGPRRAARWRAGVAAAGVLIAGGSVAAGLELSSSGGSSHTTTGDMAAVSAVLAAPDSHMIGGSVSTGGSATVIMSQRRGSLVFVASGLAPLDPSECYELWLVGQSGDRTAAILPRASGGVTGPVLATHVRPNDRLALSVEPARGSPQPTSAMILVLTL